MCTRYVFNGNRLKEIKLPHLFFFKKIIIEHDDDKENIQEEILWKSTDEAIDMSFDDDKWSDVQLDYSLVVID